MPKVVWEGKLHGKARVVVHGLDHNRKPNLVSIERQRKDAMGKEIWVPCNDEKYRWEIVSLAFNDLLTDKQKLNSLLENHH